MKNIKRFFAAAFLLSGCFFHRPAYYAAQVLMKDGAPCFSVANSRKEQESLPRISIISIFPYASDEIMPIWHQAFHRDQPAMKLSPHECLVYGAGTQIAPTLQQGFRYGVSIRASIDDHGAIYQSYFCLYKTPEGKAKIHHAKWNNKLNGYDWRICEQ